MRELTRYQCDICKAFFETPEMAQECEEFHKPVLEVRGQTYAPRRAFPVSIMVNIGGYSIRYVLSSEEAKR